MDAMPVGELKTRFSEVLESVQAGASVQILYGRAKKPVARIVPLDEGLPAKRRLGLLKNKAKIDIPENFKFKSIDEFLGQL